MKRKILIEPDPILRKKCESLEKVDTGVQNLMQDMLETMYDAPGIGLAAIQIGILKKIIVIDISKKEEEKKKPEPVSNIPSKQSAKASLTEKTGKQGKDQATFDFEGK